MIKRSLICEVGSAEPVRFYIETESLVFDYVSGTRGVKVTLIAEVDTAGQLIAGDTAQLSIFGRYFALPSRPPLAVGETKLISHSLFDIDGTEYFSSAVATLTLNYTSEVYGEISGVYSGSVALAKMHLCPEVSVTADRIKLGEDVVFTGEMLEDEAYSLTAFAVLPSGERIGLAYIGVGNGSQSSVMSSYEDWISYFPSASEFQLTLLIEGECLGTALPDTLEIVKTCYLAEGAALPSGTVTASFPSDDPAIAALGYAVRNRSRLALSVTDLTACYGASVTECRILYGGGFHYSDTFESGLLTEAGSYGYAVRLTDSRGRTSVINQGFTVEDYASPIFKASVIRVDGDGNEDKGGGSLALSAELVKWYELGGANAYRFYYRYAESGSSDASENAEFDPSGETVILSLEPTVPYDVTIGCEDSFGSVTEYIYSIDCQRIELNIAKNKIGIGKYAENDYLLDCAWDIKTAGDISFTDSSGNAVSMRDVLSGGSVTDTVKVAWANVRSQSALDELLTPTELGVKIVIVYVASYYMNIASGWHFYLTYMNDSASGYVELSTVS